VAVQIRDEELLIRIGKKIKELRLAQNLTQDQLAFEAGIIRSQIVRIERGKLNSRITTLSAISKVLDTTIDNLMQFKAE
jgi:transcriptional regulator with XRE-family HTH domain